jgi:hypothetical protein
VRNAAGPVTLAPGLLKRLRITLEMDAKAQYVEGTPAALQQYRLSGPCPIFEFLLIDNEIRHAIAEGRRETKSVPWPERKARAT